MGMVEMKKIAIPLIVMGLAAMVAQAAAVHYLFTETAAGTWEFTAEVSGADTAGTRCGCIRTRLR